MIGNGNGPTVILEGGNHGDEYEGPIVIAELLRDVDPARVNGRLILMPANNVHAVIAGRRTSPVDKLNYNRVFPGDPLGTITQQITAFMTDEIFPRGDAFLDLHSGGSSLSIMPSAVIEPSEQPELMRKNIEAVLAFNAPVAVVISNLGDPRTATATAVRSGLLTVGTEMGGGGGVSREALSICRRGVRNVLRHLGVLEGELETSSERASDLLELPGQSAFVYATSEGVFEPCHGHGDQVRAGEVAGRIHTLWHPEREPETVTYRADGIVYGIRQPGRVRPGNCCVTVAAPYTKTLV
ncbi:MAG: succinylglutamate desuccinylase/aspartoacylase family protein [Alphaproteobacteria bacterium]